MNHEFTIDFNSGSWIAKLYEYDAFDKDNTLSQKDVLESNTYPGLMQLIENENWIYLTSKNI